MLFIHLIFKPKILHYKGAKKEAFLCSNFGQQCDPPRFKIMHAARENFLWGKDYPYNEFGGAKGLFCHVNLQADNPVGRAKPCNISRFMALPSPGMCLFQIGMPSRAAEYE